MEDLLKQNQNKLAHTLFISHFEKKNKLITACEHYQNSDLTGSRLLIKCLESNGEYDYDEEATRILLTYSPFFRIMKSYVIPPKVQKKIYDHNKNKIYGKLLRLTSELWTRHGIVLLNDFSEGECLGTELRRLYEKHQPLGIIGWFTMTSPLAKGEGTSLLSCWRNEVDDENNGPNDDKKSGYQKYVIPLLDELKITYEAGQCTIKIFFDGFDLPDFISSDFA